MNEEKSSLPEQGTEKAPEEPVAPTDYREYVRWRQSSELPEKKEETPAAAGADAAQQATEPQAKTAPDSEPETPQEIEEDDETDKPKSRDSRVRKIDRLTRENAEWQQRHAELQQRLEALERKQPTAEEPKKAPPEGKPKLEDFETLEAFQEALTDFKLEQRDRARQAQEAERAAVEAQQKLQTDWAKRAKAAAKVHEDFDDVTYSTKTPEGPGVAAARQAMLEDENGAEILYYLCTHPEDIKRIAALNPNAAVREIGKLSATVVHSPTPENGKPKVTGAPKPPPSSARPSKIMSDSLDDPEVQHDFSKWERLRRAQLKGR